MEKQIIETKNYRLEVLDNGFLYSEVKGEIDLESAKLMISDRKKITNNKPVKVILFASDIFKISKEVLNYLSSDEAGEDLIATAFVSSNSIIASSIISTFLNIISSDPRSKSFTNKSDAMVWLENYS